MDAEAIKNANSPPDSDSDLASVSRWRKLRKRILRVIVIAVAVFYLLDAAYASYCYFRRVSWESSVSRDSNGVLNDCEAFSVGEGSTALLLLHGINDTPFVYKQMATYLGQHHHVRVMRMPGFGEPVSAYSAHNAEDWISQVRSEAKSLRQNHDRVIIVAHSLGGAVTVQTILRAGKDQHELFDGVVLLAPAIEVSNRRSPILPVQVWHQLSGALLFTKYTHSPFPPDTQDPEIKDFPNRTPFTPRSVIADTFRLIESNRGRATEISLPVLLAISEKDEVTDHAASAKWFEQLPSPRKKLVWINQSGHQMQYDLGWQQIADEILQFVDE